jgi:4-alpha-glucanotransferase
MHLTSLYNEEGIGSFGEYAYRFVDSLNEAGIKFWQILPLNPPDKYNCPYSPKSAFAGSYYLIDLQTLYKDGLLNTLPAWSDNIGRVSYSEVAIVKRNALKEAWTNFQSRKDFLNSDYHYFCQTNAFWLDDYSLFACLKVIMKDTPIQEWADELRIINTKKIIELREELKDEIRFEMFIQYIFFKQLKALREYAHFKNVKIIGDMPVYIGADSVEAWLSPELFKINIYHKYKEVSGVPPDPFNLDGQIWGHPIYDWNYMSKKRFFWFKERIKFLAKYFDVIRLDHVKAYVEYFSIPLDAKSAVSGHWNSAPGEVLLYELRHEIEDLTFIAEDLGHLSERLIKLLHDYRIPGMRSLQFGLDGDEYHLPFSYVKDTIAYTGTHDNNTFKGWYNELEASKKQDVKRYLNCDDDSLLNSAHLYLWNSSASVVITTIQDVLNLDSEHRMNVPGVAEGNWNWRMTKRQWEKLDFSFLKELNKIYKR